MEKEEIRVVPIWVQLKLNFKYWGEKSLFKIVQQLDTPIKRDQATASRDKIQFARVLVEVPMDTLPNFVTFLDEHGELVKVAVHYEWRPTICNSCKMVGHVASDCRKGGGKRRWVQKTIQPVAQPVVLPVVAEPEVDQEGVRL
ncbi:uncharacterized protein [Spinacia oleracea]|uniref:CCHC-type domain-containing protein n=1 Tax=Spinacia oleracea TaxID=3562 RepID=A0ABM3R8T0_SPIOL|nr:uncharacterized protein LOC130467510 [Spinacia oleracea]